MKRFESHKNDSSADFQFPSPLWNSRRYGTDGHRSSGTNPRAILGSGYASAVRVSPPALYLHPLNTKRTDICIDWRTYVSRGTSACTCLRACTCVHVIRVARVPTCPALRGERSKTWAASSLAGVFKPRCAADWHVTRTFAKVSSSWRGVFRTRIYIPCLDIRKLQLFVICENGNGTPERWWKREGRWRSKYRKRARSLEF